MGRQPSLHITEADLVLVLVGIKNDYGLKKWNSYSSREQAEIIVKKGKIRSVASRAVYISNNKVEQKVAKMKLATRSDAGRFAQILLLTRRKLKHRGIELIQPGHRDWFTIKELTKLATEFCNEQQLDIKAGYQIYLTIALNKMRNFSLNKIKGLHSAIYAEYEATEIIEKDKTPNKTREVHDFFMACINDKIGYSQAYTNIPEKYRYFVEAKQEAEKIGIPYKHYIKAQFKAFEWANAIPEPSQLVGPKALDRIQKYAFSEQLELGNNKVVNRDWSKLKKLKNANNRK